MNGVIRAGVIAAGFWGVVGFLVEVFIAFQLAFRALNFDWGQLCTNFGRLRPLVDSWLLLAMMVFCITAWPLINLDAGGVLGCSTRGEVADQIAAIEELNADAAQRLASANLSTLARDDPAHRYGAAARATVFLRTARDVTAWVPRAPWAARTCLKTSDTPFATVFATNRTRARAGHRCPSFLSCSKKRKTPPRSNRCWFSRASTTAPDS